MAHCYGFGHDIEGGEGLARRIAAALNYCKGLPTAHLLLGLPVDALDANANPLKIGVSS